MKRAFFAYFGILALISASFIPAKGRRVLRSGEGPQGLVYIVIDKSDYELKIYDALGWYGTYPVVFGNDKQSDKMMEGDRLTPEGEYKIVSKRFHEKWSRFLLIDYPNKENIERFNQLKAMGKIPAGAKIGGGIGIHGTWPREDYAIDRYLNWTNGCISLKRKDVEEIYPWIPVGTSVTIKK